MKDNLIILPVLFQLFSAVVLLFMWNSTPRQKITSVLLSLVSLAISAYIFANVYQTGIISTQAGSWKAPFGITFVADLFSSTMVLISSVAGLAVSVFSTATIGKNRLRFGYFPVLHFLIMGLNGAFLTGDIFNLYVWFEIIIIASFVLITIGGEKDQLEGAMKYVTMNLLASSIFLTAIAMLYGLTGSLNMADLSLRVAEVQNRGLVNVTAMLFFVGFGIKSAIFPLYFWLPASYHTPPFAVSAIFGGLLTKVGVYAMLRIFTLVFEMDAFLSNLILVIAILTMLTGGLGALIQNNIRRMLAYLIICHIGFMIAGLGMSTTLSFSGALYYLIHDIVVKTNIFLVAGLIFAICGTENLKMAGGLYASHPKLSLLMAIPLFSLAGIPPLSGFWPKLTLIKASFVQEDYVVFTFILLASFVTLFVLARLWAEVFWKKREHISNDDFFCFNDYLPKEKAAMVFPVIFLAAISLFLGLGAEFINNIAWQIASELSDPSKYIDIVLGN
ncbi:MAG: Na+/H+ antiporter subunit D [Cyclobacteriaceae bacterium]|nr:Na+/H+ antiporter subunit D [Cyclobacteriaceae bacterium]